MPKGGQTHSTELHTNIRGVARVLKGFVFVNVVNQASRAEVICRQLKCVARSLCLALSTDRLCLLVLPADVVTGNIIIFI